MTTENNLLRHWRNFTHTPLIVFPHLNSNYFKDDQMFFPLTEVLSSHCVKYDKFIFSDAGAIITAWDRIMSHILGTLWVVSCPSQGSDLLWWTEMLLPIPEYKQVQFNFHPYWYWATVSRLSERSHCVICLIPFTFPSYYAEHEKVYLSFRVASATNTSTISTVFSWHTRWTKTIYFRGLFVLG